MLKSQTVAGGAASATREGLRRTASVYLAVHNAKGPTPAFLTLKRKMVEQFSEAFVEANEDVLEECLRRAASRGGAAAAAPAATTMNGNSTVATAPAVDAAAQLGADPASPSGKATPRPVLGLFLLRPPAPSPAAAAAGLSGGGAGNLQQRKQKGPVNTAAAATTMVVLASVLDLSSFPHVQRPVIGQMMRFAVKQFVGGGGGGGGNGAGGGNGSSVSQSGGAPLSPGVRGTCTVDTGVGFNIHATVDAASGVAGAVVVSADYPRRVAWKVVEMLISDFNKGGATPSAAAMNSHLQTAQDPGNLDVMVRARHHLEVAAETTLGVVAKAQARQEALDELQLTVQQLLAGSERYKDVTEKIPRTCFDLIALWCRARWAALIESTKAAKHKVTAAQRREAEKANDTYQALREQLNTYKRTLVQKYQEGKFNRLPRDRLNTSQYLKSLQDKVKLAHVSQVQRKDLLARYHVCAVLADRNNRTRPGEHAADVDRARGAAAAAGAAAPAPALRTGTMAAAEVQAMDELDAKDAQMDALGLQIIDSLLTFENVVAGMGEEMDSQQPLIVQTNDLAKAELERLQNVTDNVEGVSKKIFLK